MSWPIWPAAARPTTPDQPPMGWDGKAQPTLDFQILQIRKTTKMKARCPHRARTTHKPG
ncbi:MAG: hypothetical protein NT172_11770 [Planctomycetota bacterium]|nr:hypothetical protein [Planctomycetota bacterium]